MTISPGYVNFQKILGNNNIIPTQEELDSKLGQPAKLQTLWGILVKNKTNGKYAVWDRNNLFPGSIDPTPGIEYSKITIFTWGNWMKVYEEARDSLIHPSNSKQLCVSNSWYYHSSQLPIVKVETYPLSCIYENISSAKKSLGSDMEFFFPKDPNINDDGTLKVKGPREFL
jgi:hypothetical protein